MASRITTKDFVEKARAIHEDKYDYSKVEYVNARTSVTIICPEHGAFQQKPEKHIGLKRGCSECAIARSRLTQSEFLMKAIEVHGDTYDYSKVEYTGTRNKITIGCGIHGDFQLTPNHHLKSRGCRRCADDKYRRTLGEFVTKSEEVHGCKYDYSKVEYVNKRTSVVIICPKHGEFTQGPDKHLKGYGCIQCGREAHPGSISKKKLERSPELAKTPYYLYYVKLSEKSTGKVYHKIGIEKTQYSRWRSGVNWDVEYIKSISGSLELCWGIEQRIKDTYNTGISKEAWPYNNGGRTEMLEEDFLYGGAILDGMKAAPAWLQGGGDEWLV